MTNFLQFCPQDLFNGGQNKDGAIPIADATAQSTVAAGTNVIIAAVTGKVARIISMNYSATGAVPGLMAITSNGVTKYADVQPANTVAPVVREFSPAGHCDSVVGFGMSLVTTVTGNFSARYIYYTP